MERERGWRKMGTHLNVVPDMPATQFEDVAALLGFSGLVLDADVFARLVELIDRPTCRNIGGEEGTNRENYDFFCSACGYAGCFAEPNFCPNCGAEVIE